MMKQTYKKIGLVGMLVGLVLVLVLFAASREERYSLSSLRQSEPQTPRSSIQPLNDSGVSGTVVLTALDETTTQVTVVLEPNSGPAHPIHLHQGSCQDVGPIEYALNRVDNGLSVTELRVGLEEIIAQDLVVNVHRSKEAVSEYIACGSLQ